MRGFLPLTIGVLAHDSCETETVLVWAGNYNWEAPLS